VLQPVSLSVSFHLHNFSAPTEHFLPKELSQNFTPIPGDHMELPLNGHYPLDLLGL
jgi:hypothetical protein